MTMTTPVVGFAGLQVGKPYTVTFEDCCVQGEFFAGIFVRYEDEDNTAVFTQARCEGSWGPWTFTVAAP